MSSSRGPETADLAPQGNDKRKVSQGEFGQGRRTRQGQRSVPLWLAPAARKQMLQCGSGHGQCNGHNSSEGHASYTLDEASMIYAGGHRIEHVFSCAGRKYVLSRRRTAISRNVAKQQQIAFHSPTQSTSFLTFRIPISLSNNLLSGLYCSSSFTTLPTCLSQTASVFSPARRISPRTTSRIKMAAAHSSQVAIGPREMYRSGSAR